MSYKLIAAVANRESTDRRFDPNSYNDVSQDRSIHCQFTHPADMPHSFFPSVGEYFVLYAANGSAV